MKYSKEKINKFNEMCCDWDFRDIDMTEPHLSGISIKNNVIYPVCELYSPEIEYYVNCDGNVIKSKNLLKMFKKLDIDDKYDVREFMNYVEWEIDWERVSDNLSNQINLEKEKCL